MRKFPTKPLRTGGPAKITRKPPMIKTGGGSKPKVARPVVRTGGIIPPTPTVRTGGGSQPKPVVKPTSRARVHSAGSSSTGKMPHKPRIRQRTR